MSISLNIRKLILKSGSRPPTSLNLSENELGVDTSEKALYLGTDNDPVKIGPGMSCSICDYVGVVIITQPDNQVARVGDMVQFNVEANEVAETYTWQYRRRGSWYNIPASTQGITMNGGNMTVDVTQARNGATYRCRVSGGDGLPVDSLPATLTVLPEEG